MIGLVQKYCAILIEEYSLQQPGAFSELVAQMREGVWYKIYWQVKSNCTADSVTVYNAQENERCRRTDMMMEMTAVC